MPPKNYSVVKLYKKESADIPANFPSYGILYLELFENKAKIKQDLVNKDHVPTKDGLPKMKDDVFAPKTTAEIPHVREERVKSSSSSSRSEKVYSSSSSEVESRSPAESSKSKTTTSSSSSSKDSGRISDRLIELLDDSRSSKSREVKIKSHSAEKYETVDFKKASPFKQAPTLAELQQRGEYYTKPEMRDVNQSYVNDSEVADKKREMMFKFNLLRKSYPNSANEIPEITQHTDLLDMQKEYDSTLRKLSIDNTVDTYKLYLTYGFGVVEYVFGKYLNFDMAGFTASQTASMGSYDRLLIELGEKSYVPSGSSWPVEVRLMGLIIMNATMFVFGKMIMNKSNVNMFATVQPPKGPKPKPMRGPNMDDL